VFVAPDRPVEVTRHQAVTNFQHKVEWPEHAKATRSPERLACLEAKLAANGPLDDAVGALLQPPLFQASYLRGYGTLYTAAYRPATRQVELHWPGLQPWQQSVGAFAAGQREITYTSSGE
jgi:predicted choloylglycine hydrolase